MIRKDEDRIRRASSITLEKNIDLVLLFSKQNIRYIVGAPVDYSLGFITSDGGTGVLCSILEYERAKEVTWADSIYGYNPYSTNGDENVIKARSIYDALPTLVSKVLDRGAVIGIPYSELSHKEFLMVRRKLKDYKVANADDIIRDSRIVKTSHETELINRAIRITESGVLHSIRNIMDGVVERDLALESEYIMKKEGAEKIYEFLIVASGHRSSLPHGRASDKVIRKGDPVTMDYVASYDGYYGDITRTVFVGEVKSEMRKVYSVVLEALEAAISVVADGVKASRVDAEARKVIDEHGYGKFFIHSTGHGIGLDVHEPPRLSSADKTILREGMIVTVEPGIYIQGKGGIRIEEDVLVKKGGCEVLSSLDRDLLVL